MTTSSRIALILMGSAALTAGANAASTTVAGFDGGSNDGFMGNAFFEATGGNPGGVAHTPDLIEFPSLRTGGVGEPANPGFLGDYSSFSSVTFGVDAKTVSMLDFIGNQTSRPLGVALINRNITGTDGPAGVYFQLGNLSVFENPDWTSYSVTIDDPTSTTLPSGWIGFGSTNSSFAPELPAGTTFADILAGVTEFQISGAVPGFFFGPVFPNYYLDNISVTVPAPGAAAPMLGLIGLLGSRRRR
ncbi:MAG: hypothetical protein KDA21_04080 [Phycisphaerales bacterium]|nr:hypothetical protein [Phycisphaerales bacterium]